MKCSVYIAQSLEGFIARADGGIDWLRSVERPGEDYGYAHFFESVDTLIIGRATYETALGFDGWPYAGKHVVVMTRRSFTARHGEHFFAGDPATLVRELASTGRQHAYVDGGDVIRQFLAAGLVRSLTLSVLPLLLGEGLRLFGATGRDVPLALVRSASFPSGLVQTEYVVEPSRYGALEPEKLAFRRLTRADLPLIPRWCAEPHVRRWYERNDSLEKVIAEYAPCIDGSVPIAPYLVLYDGRPVGMMEWMRFGDFPEEARLYGVTDPEIVNCDVLLGDPAVAHRGLGAPMIRRFLREVVFTDPRVQTCLIDPEIANHSAIRAYAKAGFRHARDIPDDGDGHPLHLMELSRHDLFANP